MNKWTGIGRLTKDPDVRYTQKGTEQMCIARYTLAIDRRVTKETDFIPCVAFGKQGEFAEKYLKQGIKIGVCGRIQTGSYTNKDGQKVYTTDIVVEEQEFVEPKKTEPPESNGFINIPEDVENTLPWK
jgi:single-strand DNA-binding protein